MEKYKIMINFKPSDGFTGDPIPFYHKGKFHLFYLKKKEKYLFWSHSETENFITWKECPDILLPGEKGSSDEKGCWTGSVVEKDGIFHIFYTGFNPDKRFPQVICHATSSDLIFWKKDEKNPIVLPDTKIYQKDDWRDPYVFWNKREKRWWMLITARIKSKSYFSGCIALAKSYDFNKWDVFPPLWISEICKTPECSDLFRKGNLWYLIFSDLFKTSYVFSREMKNFYFNENINVDEEYFYAGKCFHTGKKDYVVGWIPTLEGKKDNGKKEWGGYLSIPREIEKIKDTLYFKLPERLKETFKKKMSRAFSSFPLTLEGYGTKFLSTKREISNGIFYTEIEKKQGLRFGVFLRANEDFSSGYFIEIFRKGLMIKNSPVISATPLILRNFSLDEKKYRMWISLNNENLEIFLNDRIVLTGKTYNFKKGKFGIYVSSCKILVKEFTFTTDFI